MAETALFLLRLYFQWLLQAPVSNCGWSILTVTSVIAGIALVVGVVYFVIYVVIPAAVGLAVLALLSKMFE